MSIFNKVILKTKNEKLSMEKASQEQKDQEFFVSYCIKTRGIEEFELASSRLKSDAQFILDLVATCPECLTKCDKVVYDRYEQDGEIIETPIDAVLFAAMCCEKNVEAFKYIQHNVAQKYIKLAESRDFVEGKFHDENISVKLEKDTDYLKLIKYGFVNSKSMYAQCREI